MEVTTDYLMVSIVVPVRNEADNIESCLGNLIAQSYPGDRFEIIVVDGMSDDGTREMVGRFVEESSSTIGGERPKVRLLDNPKGQRSSALNIGVSGADGEIIVRIDARTIVSADYVERCVETLLETGADNVGGVQKPVSEPGRNCVTQQAIGLALSHPFGVGDAQFRLGTRSGYVDTVYLGCFRKEIFDTVGLFDEQASVISEDSDMNFRINRAGGKVYLNKDIVACYYPRDNFRDLSKLYFRYGGAKAGNWLKYHKLTAWRQLIPPLFLACCLLLPLLGYFHKAFIYAWLFVLGTYACVDVFVSACISVREKNLSLFFVLLLTFPILHFSWASGFWRRLFQRPEPGAYWGY